jgi:hypothetical protein
MIKYMGNWLKHWWLKALLIGVAIRLILMPITVHPDLWGHSFIAYFFAYKGELNIYDFLFNLSKDYPLVKNIGITDIFIYPPLAYFTLGIFRVLVKPFADPNFLPWLMNNIGNFYSYPNLKLQIFLFKLPYLFVDAGCAFLLAGLFTDLRKKSLAFSLWMFNPITIYATFMIGQLDILPVFFTILSCYLIKKKKAYWGLFSLGIGAAYKIYPLLLIPPAAFLLGETFWRKVKLISVGLLPYILAILPYLGSRGFRAMVLFGPKETKMLFMNWPVTAAEGVFPFILVLTIVYLMSYFSEKKLNIEIYFLSILLLIFSVTHYHPQWFLWVAPFLVWVMVAKSFKYIEIIIILTVSWIILTLFFESSLSWGLFAPVWPSLARAPGLTDILMKYIDVAQFKSVIRSAFAGASLFYCWKIVREGSVTES